MGFNFSRNSEPAGIRPEAVAAIGGSDLRLRAAFAGWFPSRADADGDLQSELGDHRSFARELDRTSPSARAGFDQKVAYRVSTGLKLQARVLHDWVGITPEQAEEHNKKVQQYFEMWAEDPRASVEGDQNFYQMQRTIARSQTISGDVFTALVRKKRKDWPFTTALQMFEADRICNKDNKANGEGLFEGIERSQIDGEILGIWVAKYHPGRRISTKPQEWKYIPITGQGGRRNVIFRKDMRRPGQSRGMGAISVITSIIKQITRYTEAEVEAAVNSAAFNIFAEMDTQSFQDLFNDEQRKTYLEAAFEARQGEMGLTSGKLLNVLPGERITSPTPGRPNPNFSVFVDSFYTLMGMGLGLPPEVLTGLFKSSYTAARASLQQLFQMIAIERQDDETHTCQPVYETWYGDCVADGIIPSPGFFLDPFARRGWCNATWTGTGQPSLNPRDEAEAAVLRAGSITTEAEESQNYDGGDWDERHVQRVREARMRREGGLPPLGSKPVATDPNQTADTMQP